MTAQSQAKARTLAREALSLVKERAPAIVDERIIPEMLDEISHYTGEIMGKLTNLDADNEKNIVMAHGIIHDGLLQEVIDQVRKIQHDAAAKRFDKLSAK